MRLMLHALFGMTLAIGGCATASAQGGSDGAEAFVRSVYASYTEDGPWPIDEARLDEVFTARTGALIRRDRELSGDDLPYLDADPICNCQDFEDIRVVESGSDRDAEGRVIVRVRFVNGGEEMETDFLMAGDPNQGWRIDDILNADGYPSLADNLAASNARLEGGGQALGRD